LSLVYVVPVHPRSNLQQLVVQDPHFIVGTSLLEGFNTKLCLLFLSTSCVLTYRPRYEGK